MVLFVKREQPARHLPRVDSLDKSEIENTQLYPQNRSDHGLSDPLTVHLALGLRWGNTSACASPFVVIMYQYCWDLKRRRRDAIRKHRSSIVLFIFPTPLIHDARPRSTCSCSFVIRLHLSLPISTTPTIFPSSLLALAHNSLSTYSSSSDGTWLCAFQGSTLGRDIEFPYRSFFGLVSTLSVSANSLLA
jgi:hypothetical protein